MGATIIEKGRHFRDVQLRLWGNRGRILVVEAVFVGGDGLEHARLFCADEPSLRKTLSISVLKDKRRFEPAESTSWHMSWRSARSRNS